MFEIIVVLTLLALLLFAAELILPGGIAAIVGVALLIAVSVMAQVEYGGLAGLFAFLLSTILTLAVIIIEIYVLKKSPLRRFIIHEGTIAGTSNVNVGTESLAGSEGRTLTTLAPSGKVMVNDKVFEAAAQEGYLAKDTPIIVVRAESFRIVVKSTQATDNN